MRSSLYSALCLSLVVVSCAKSANKAVDSTANAGNAPPAMAPGAPTAAPAPTVSLADVAGKWNLVSTPTEGKDTTSTKAMVTATADTTGWAIAFPGRKPVPLHVTASGDSIMAVSGKYESVRRKGVQVTTSSVFRLQGGKLVGTLVAHYNTKGPDSVMHFQTAATKAP
jgi:hypothetical protein